MEKIFESERIDFATISEDFIDDFLQMVNDMEGVARFISKKTTPYSVEEEKAFIQLKLNEKAPIFSMFDKDTKKFIGNIELMDVKEDSAIMGISITASQQEKQYGREAIHRILDYGFDTLGLNRITLNVYKFNDRAKHVYEKCGFTQYDETDEDYLMEIFKK